MTNKIEYVITPVNPQAHLFNIRCTIHEPHPDGQVIWLPAWIPGSYMIRDFAKNIVTIAAESAKQNIDLKKIDKQTWQCQPCDTPLTIDYQVYAWDMSVRSAHLDTTHGFFNGSSVFVAVKGQEHEPVSISINLPDGKPYQHWRVATTLSRNGAELFAAGAYQASCYDELIDHPVEMGTFTETQFEVNGIPHHIVITGKQVAELARLSSDAKKICSTHVNMFTELPPMERYIFLLTVVDNGYGGLEHRNSSALICSRADLPLPHMDKPSEKYITLLGLFSHEYFHTWNVKRIRPRTFMPYQLQAESYTTLLWAFEGITSYYDDLGLVRSGVINESEYFELLGKNITRVLRGTGRHKQSMTESSFDAWTKFYKQDENAPNAIVSYYAKGALFALCLDMEIRKRSNDKFTLDHVMRELWEKYGRTDIGIEENTILHIIKQVTSLSLADFFDNYLATTLDLPLPDALKSMGISLQQRAATGLDDPGGTALKPNDQTLLFNLGTKLIADDLGARVQFIYEQGDLQKAGVAVGDIIVALNGLKVTKDNIGALLVGNKVGDKIPCHVFRRDELMTYEITLTQAKSDTYYLEAMPDVELANKRQAWLLGGYQQAGSSK